MRFHGPPLKKLCQEGTHNLLEYAPMMGYLPEALSIVRQEIGQLIRLVKNEDTEEESWTLLRAPWTLPDPSEDKFTQSNEVNVSALSATAHPPTSLASHS